MSHNLDYRLAKIDMDQLIRVVRLGIRYTNWLAQQYQNKMDSDELSISNKRHAIQTLSEITNHLAELWDTYHVLGETKERNIEITDYVGTLIRFDLQEEA